MAEEEIQVGLKLTRRDILAKFYPNHDTHVTDEIVKSTQEMLVFICSCGFRGVLSKAQVQRAGLNYNAIVARLRHLTPLPTESLKGLKNG